MLKHAAIIGVSVISAVIAAQAVVMLAGARAAPAVVQSVTTPIAATAVLAEEPAPAPAQVTKASDGHYWAQAQVNGRWVKFLVDTGASTVALTGADAQRLGFDLDTLNYVHPVITAAGKTAAAAVTLDAVSIAGARVEKVDALVLRDGLATSLLGMSYLGRLTRFEATKTALILRP